VSYRIVTCDDSEIISDDIWTVYNTKCSDALSSIDEHVAVQLRPEMGSGVSLLDWIGKWQDNFTEKGKKLYIISDDQQQLESMELSHPGQNLVYMTSIQEFEEQLGTMSSAYSEEEFYGEGQIDGKQTAAPVVEDVYEEREYFDSTGIQKPLSIEEQQNAVKMSVGDIVEIAGEYTCQSCGSSRMWMKGKKVTGCQNPECFDPSKGWQLDFDLF